MSTLKNNSTAAAEQTPHSPWAEAIVNASLPHAPKTASLQAKAAFLAALVKKLEACREFERMDPRTMESVVLKTGYEEVAMLEGHTRTVRCLQALPDGRIVSGSEDNTLRIWTERGRDERNNILGAAIRWLTKREPKKWSSELLAGHTAGVWGLQALPGGQIVSGSADGTIRIWDGTPVEGGAS